MNCMVIAGFYQMFFLLRFPRFFPSPWLKTFVVSVDHQHDLLGTSSSSAMPEGGEAKGWRVDANKTIQQFRNISDT